MGKILQVGHVKELLSRTCRVDYIAASVRIGDLHRNLTFECLVVPDQRVVFSYELGYESSRMVSITTFNMSVSVNGITVYSEAGNGNHRVKCVDEQIGCLALEAKKFLDRNEEASNKSFLNMTGMSESEPDGLDS